MARTDLLLAGCIPAREGCRQLLRPAQLRQASLRKRAVMHAVRDCESGLSVARIVLQGGGRGFGQAFRGLAGDLGDEVEVLVQVQYGQPGEFSSRGDDQIRYRRSTMLAPVREQGQDL